ncbi:EnvZ/OmpR regulon moderator MzrA [[Pantoea] beijingensis]|nr:MULTISPECIES: EnvZ/OmpR regulon moderator MzrA [Erwiniaceae]
MTGQLKSAAGRRYLLPGLFLAALVLLALTMIPTLFRTETAVQIRTSHEGIALPDGFYIYQRLNAQGIQIKSITPDDDNALVIKFDSEEESLAAQKFLHTIFPNGFVIAQIDSPSSKYWITRLGRHHQSVG